jgi:polysaccharide export outer membrane protein
MSHGHFLRLSVVFVTALPFAAQLPAQQQDASHPIYSGVPEANTTSNLPIQKVGPEDLLGLGVYDAPEFTRTVRIAADGTIRLPMLKEAIRVEGLFPSDVEVLLAEALKREGLFVDPFVTVNVVEYHSRPISVGGMVRTPVIFQAVGKVTLLDALARAGGVVPDIPSGCTSNEVVVTRSDGDSGTPLVQHIPLKKLISGADPALNLTLLGGEEIRVPDVGKIVVTGNVVHPGVVPFLDPAETNTVKSAIGQAQGLAQYWGSIGYIYRTDEQGKTNEIVIPLRKIMERKAPDVVLQARDVLYVPDSSGRRITQETVTALMGVGAGATTALIYVLR